MSPDMSINIQSFANDGPLVASVAKPKTHQRVEDNEKTTTRRQLGIEKRTSPPKKKKVEYIRKQRATSLPTCGLMGPPPCQPPSSPFGESLTLRFLLGVCHKERVPVPAPMFPAHVPYNRILGPKKNSPPVSKYDVSVPCLSS